MTKPSIQIAVAILVSLTIGFFIGRAVPAKKSMPDIASQQVAPKSPSAKEEGTVQLASNSEGSNPKAVTANQEATGNPEQPAQEIEKIETKAPAEEVASIDPSAKGTVLERMIKGISDQKISNVLEEIAQNMEKQKLIYDSSLGQDCSGIFHRIKDSIQARIPALKGTEYQYPEFKSIRSSRQIADWYHRNNNLLIVEDPIASRNSIRPGSVMFFAKPGKKFRNMTIEQLTDNKNNFTSNGYIMHIAVVTSVQTDENDNVIAYTMMHGRNKRHPASRSGSKEVQSTRTTGLPAFGNWSQQWVAVANIATLD